MDASPDDVQATRMHDQRINHSVKQVVLHDSIAALTPQDRGCIVVSGSHGGMSAAIYARNAGVVAALFNDAGGGKDNAGTSGLELLEAASIPALAVAHTSARIGDAKDTLRSGVVSALNTSAYELGIRIGQTVQMALAFLQKIT
jgi:hypothetical protein